MPHIAGLNLGAPGTKLQIMIVPAPPVEIVDNGLIAEQEMDGPNGEQMMVSMHTFTPIDGKCAMAVILREDYRRAA